jgi:hypothetical protein
MVAPTRPFSNLAKPRGNQLSVLDLRCYKKTFANGQLKWWALLDAFELHWPDGALQLMRYEENQGLFAVNKLLAEELCSVRQTVVVDPLIEVRPSLNLAT